MLPILNVIYEKLYNSCSIQLDDSKWWLGIRQLVHMRFDNKLIKHFIQRNRKFCIRLKCWGFCIHNDFYGQ